MSKEDEFFAGFDRPLRPVMPTFTREEIEFIRDEFYASLANGAEHPLFEQVYQRAKAILGATK